jgi:peptidoglycan hydrolase-like protein with peptidoglycan-binding domain
MKRSIVSMVFVATMVAASAQVTTASCVNIPYGLARGMENSHVLALQQFLYAKGLLKATPNGYFGPATLAAVKFYQASVTLPTTGGVFALTRAAIQKESCAAATTTPRREVAAESPVGGLPQMSASAVTYPFPQLQRAEKGTLFANASSTSDIVLTGQAFSASNNRVYLKVANGNRKYLVGTYPSENAFSVIRVPASFTQVPLSCGYGCTERVAPGGYELTVQTEGGESNPLYISVEGLTVSSMTGTQNAPIRQNAAGARIATVYFSSTVPVFLTSMDLAITLENLSEGALSNFMFKDELTGMEMAFNDSDLAIPANASKIVGIYADVSSTRSGVFSGSVIIGFEDFVGKKQGFVTTPLFYGSVSGL